MAEMVGFHGVKMLGLSSLSLKDHRKWVFDRQTVGDTWVYLGI